MRQASTHIPSKTPQQPHFQNLWYDYSSGGLFRTDGWVRLKAPVNTFEGVYAPRNSIPTIKSETRIRGAEIATTTHRVIGITPTPSLSRQLAWLLWRLSYPVPGFERHRGISPDLASNLIHQGFSEIEVKKAI